MYKYLNVLTYHFRAHNKIFWPIAVKENTYMQKTQLPIREISVKGNFKC